MMACGQAVIDCEVHCSVPDVGALMPYMSRHWRARLTENAWAGPAGIAHCYPAPAVGEGIETLEQLHAQMLTPALERAVLVCYYAVEAIRHPDLSAELAHAVNRWLKEQWLDRDQRLVGTMVVTPEYPQAAAAEIRSWESDDGFVQVLLPVVSQRTYGNRSYFPIYQAAEERGLVIGLHFGGVSGGPPTPSGWPDLYIEEAVGMTHVFQGQLLSLVAEGVFQEFPSLRFALLESGVTWLPSLLWRLDKMWKSYRREIPWVTRPPSTYVRDRVRAAIAPLDVPGDPREALRFVEDMELEELLMFSTDRPHAHAFDPMPMLDLMEPARREPIMSAKARDWYGLG
jgi:predicted TIM-barrel fold metal-dependent hydrolase